MRIYGCREKFGDGEVERRNYEAVNGASVQYIFDFDS